MRAVIALLVVLCFVGAFAANLDHMRRVRQPGGQKAADAAKGGKDKTLDAAKDKDAAGTDKSKDGDAELDTLTIVSCFSEQIASKKESSKKGTGDAATSSKKTKNSDDDDDGDNGNDDDDDMFLEVFGNVNVTRAEFAKQIGNPKEFCASGKNSTKKDTGKGEKDATKKDAGKGDATKGDKDATKKDATKKGSFIEEAEDPAEVDEDASNPKDGLNNQKNKKAKGDGAKDKDAAATDKSKDKDAAATDKSKDKDASKDKKVKGAKRFCTWYNKNVKDLAAKCAKYKADQQPTAALFPSDAAASSNSTATF